MTLIIIIILIVISGISKSIMDTCNFHFEQSIFFNNEWFNMKESWKNKYKDRDPLKGPAFFGSTTFFVWVTDAWHFFQQIMLSSLFLSIILALSLFISLNWYYWILIFFGLKSLMTVTFELFWSKIWVKH